jgi:hypothetical protein
MTTKQAADNFNMEEREIRKLCKEGKIHGVRKVKNRYEIPDETVMIITDENARAFLWQLLKFKNNPSIILEESFADTDEKLSAWYTYLTEQGLAGGCGYVGKLKELLKKMQLTEKGFATIAGKTAHSIHIEPHFNINLACVSASVL